MDRNLDSCAGFVVVGSMSLIVIVPFAGAMSPAIAESNVDLPQPLGPTITVIEADGICSL
jgi:hypothetical protein